MFVSDNFHLSLDLSVDAPRGTGTPSLLVTWGARVCGCVTLGLTWPNWHLFEVGMSPCIKGVLLTGDGIILMLGEHQTS